MSSSRGNAGGGRNAVSGKGNNGGALVSNSIPQASKKMVQSLKEIVSCSELEIYAMLKECNMDPNEAVSRLLSQDPFHEVKSKKEKKKEYKDATDSRSRGGSSTLNRGARGGNDRYGRAILSQFSSSEAGTSRAKPTYKKDSVAPYTGSSSMPVMSGNNVNWPPTSVSEVTVESQPLAVGASGGFPSLSPPSGFQSVWPGPGVPGQLSMADIVKMGRPHGRASPNVNPSEQNINRQHAVASQLVPTHGLHTSDNYAAKVSEFSAKSGGAGSQHLPPNDGWPQVEQPQTVSMTSLSEPPVISEYEEPSTVPFERTNHHSDNVQSERNTEIGDYDNLLASRKMQEEISANPSVFNDSHHNINSYQVHRPAFEQQEVEDASISAINIQQLSLSNEEEEEEQDEEDDEVEEEDFPKEADSPAVKIPEHLQVQSFNCSHLSFGSFASAVNAPFSQTFASGPEKSNIEETSVTADSASMGHTDTRNVEYYDDEHLRTVSDGDIGQRLAASAGGYDMPTASQSETLKQEAVEVAPGNQYSFPPSNTFENGQQLNPSFSHPQTNSQMQNLPQFSGVMAYSDSLPSSLLPSNVQPVRDAELPYSPFPTAQSMPGKYSSSVSSASGPTISMTEAMKTVNLPSPQPEQNLPGSNIAGAPGFPHLAMHPYSQPSLPFANMIGYPFMPQSYTYMPSAFQQAIAAAGNSTYHQSLAAAAAAAHPQYKNSVSGGNLPQSAAVPSGYGAFGSSTSVPGNFPLNPSQPPAAPSATSMSYEDLLNSQYKDAAHLLALQQGLGSRTMSAVPASAYYGLQGQTQQPAGYRQNQQLPSPPQHYSNLGGYPNFYHSQAGLSLEAQQQMSRDQSLGGSQGQQQPKQPQQMWPNGY